MRWTVKCRPPSKRRKIDCLGCGVDTSFATGNGHYYLVHDALWLRAVPGGRGMLCLDCLEKRLGRPLTRADFERTPFEIVSAFAPPQGFADYLDEMEAARQAGKPEIDFETWTARRRP
jgi:hypothetical protein